jgi:DNA-directed RNA polymerase subunit omega
MAEQNIDKLLMQTGSKYRLSVVIAKRALQLRAGTQSVLPPEQRVKMHNLVTVAMREMAIDKLIVGEQLIDEERLSTDLLRKKQQDEKAAQERSHAAEM